MARFSDMLYPGETVLWRTAPVWKAVRLGLAAQAGAVVVLFLIGMAAGEDFDSGRFRRMLFTLLTLAVPTLLMPLVSQGLGVMVTDRRVLWSRGFFRPRREELERRHIAAVVVYEGDETLLLRAARPDAIRLVEPDSRASLRATGETEMSFAKASVDKDAMLEALAIEPERIRPAVRPDAVTNLHGARYTLAVAGALLSALAIGVAAELALPDLNGALFALSIIVALGPGALFGLWSVWPVARFTVPLETARIFASTLYHPDWKAVYPVDESWRNPLRRAERLLSWLYGGPVALEDLPRPAEAPAASGAQP